MMKEIGTHAIKTERLLLRRFVESDIKPYYDNYGCDQAVQEYIAWFDCKTLDDTEDFVHEHLKKYDDPYFFGWVIEYEGEVIGSIGCFNVNPFLSCCEIGYSIGSRWWNKGIVSEGAKAVVDYMFKEVGVHRIYASYTKENIASGRVMEKIGMKYEGTAVDGIMLEDGYHDLVYYAIINSQKP